MVISCFILSARPWNTFGRLCMFRSGDVGPVSATTGHQSRTMSTTPTDASEVIFHRSDNTGLIHLNRPKALNSLNMNMVQLLHEKIKEWTHDGIKLIVCKGGEKAFCAGGDVVTIYRRRNDPEYQKKFFGNEYILDHQIGSLSVPYVALIHGITMGGGVGISVHGKYRVATEKTMFAMPETAIGLFCDVGGSYTLPRLRGKLGTYLGLTGNRLVGKDVKHAGIATHYVEAAMLPDLEKDLMKLNHPDYKSVEEVLDKYEHKTTIHKDHEFSLASEVDKINRIFGEPSVEKIFQALEKDNSEWSKKNLDTLNKMSPTSMKIVLRQMSEGKSKTLAECFKMEYRIVCRVLQGSDYYEGSRAKLVDKDNNPRWHPLKLEDVADADIDAIFEPFSNSEDELKLEK